MSPKQSQILEYILKDEDESFSKLKHLIVSSQKVSKFVH